MPTSILQPAVSAHRVVPDVAPRMAKADLRKADVDDFRAAVGRAVERARQLLGWSLKEFAAHVQRDERQVSRWERGEERAQFDVLFGVEELRQPLVIALAELAGDRVEIETVVRVRRAIR